ncbi:hypothetical protein [uncultured Ramlibacter sp.]|uniref:hypothetical protein n=1 Tax=uncultured Ramlibacter sp. TaxID=260755 RepID=UPI00263424AC|nr:hypothetical protein [uncultured Ramlibacter sp.]
MQQDPLSGDAPRADLDALAAQAHDALVDKQERADALQQRRQSSPLLRGAAGSVAILALSFLAWQAVDGAPAPTPEQLDQGRHAMLNLVSDSLAEHVRVHGSYPERLEEALPLQTGPSIDYRRTAGGYELDLRSPDGRVLTVRHG